jgi:periplasmic copper chaperone A
VPHIRTAAAVLAAALALPAAASAHVTLQPNTAAAGGFTRLDVRVPNERDDSATVKVDVQFPDGFDSVSYEPRAGWKVQVRRSGERVSRITWSGGRIEPGQFTDFGLSLRIPDGDAGEKLTFKALQTYDNGEVVRWIGPEDGDEPAPIVTLTAADGGGHGAPGTDPDAPVSSDDAVGAREPAPAENASAPAEASEDDGGGNGFAIAALVVAVLALVAALRPRARKRA